MWISAWAGFALGLFAVLCSACPPTEQEEKSPVVRSFSCRQGCAAFSILGSPIPKARHTGCSLGEASLPGSFAGATHCWQGPPLPWRQAALHPSSLTFQLCSCFPKLESAGFSQQGDLFSFQKAGVTLTALSRASCTALVFSAWFSFLLVPLLR